MPESYTQPTLFPVADAEAPIKETNVTHSDLVLLVNHLADRGEPLGVILHAVEKPYNYGREIREAKAALEVDA